LKAALAARAACALALCLLSACAGSGVSGPQELKTASDTTAAEKRASIRLQLAVGYYQAGKYEIALDEVKKAIAANPDYADAYGLRALVYTAMGEVALADENYQRALNLAPHNPDLENNYGSFLCNAGGKPAKAMPYFEAALESPAYQSPVNALVNAGNCSLKLNKPDAAERYLLGALRYDPNLAVAEAGLARIYFERRDFERAGFFINRLTAATKLDTLSAEVLWLAIRVERKLGDRTTEATLAAQLRQRFPGSPELAAFERGAFE
jgi:type IV pilus assembly protein PilF